jgi:hypothetical protein
MYEKAPASVAKIDLDKGVVTLLSKSGSPYGMVNLLYSKLHHYLIKTKETDFAQRINHEIKRKSSIRHFDNYGGENRDQIVLSKQVDFNPFASYL